MKNWELSFFIHFPTQLSKDRMGKSKSITFEAYIWFWFIISNQIFSHHIVKGHFRSIAAVLKKKYLNFYHEYTLSNNMWVVEQSRNLTLCATCNIFTLFTPFCTSIQKFFSVGKPWKEKEKQKQCDDGNVRRKGKSEYSLQFSLNTWG